MPFGPWHPPPSRYESWLSSEVNFTLWIYPTNRSCWPCLSSTGPTIPTCALTPCSCWSSCSWTWKWTGPLWLCRLCTNCWPGRRLSSPWARSTHCFPDMRGKHLTSRTHWGRNDQVTAGALDEGVTSGNKYHTVSLVFISLNLNWWRVKENRRDFVLGGNSKLTRIKG